MKNKKKKKGMNYTSMKCPYCGSIVEYRSANGIYKENSYDSRYWDEPFVYSNEIVAKVLFY